MFQAANVMKEMKRLDRDIHGCSEVRWPISGHRMVDDYHTYTIQGNSSSRNRNGVAIIVKKEVKSEIIEFAFISDRGGTPIISAIPTNMNIIICYAQNTKSIERTIKIFYHNIQDALKTTKKHDINIVLGDFNAKVGDTQAPTD